MLTGMAHLHTVDMVSVLNVSWLGSVVASQSENVFSTQDSPTDVRPRRSHRARAVIIACSTQESLAA